MSSIEEVVKNKLYGLHYGNRILLPFKAYFLKIIIENDIVMNMGARSGDIVINEAPDFTEIYFLQYKDLSHFITKFETIKMVVSERGKDIFDFKNHKKIALHLKEKHMVTIEEIDEDILFIE
jgi:hypothetical protein